MNAQTIILHAEGLVAAVEFDAMTRNLRVSIGEQAADRTIAVIGLAQAALHLAEAVPAHGSPVELLRSALVFLEEQPGMLHRTPAGLILPQGLH